MSPPYREFHDNESDLRAKQKECSRLRLHSNTVIPLVRKQTLSFCLRDSACALHLRHSKMSFSRESLHGSVCFPESITPSEGHKNRFPELFRRVYFFVNLLYRILRKKQPSLLQKKHARQSIFLCNIYSIRALFFEKSKNLKKSQSKVIAFFSAI